MRQTYTEILDRFRTGRYWDMVRKNTFRCEVCGEKFWTEAALKKHVAETDAIARLKLKYREWL